MPDMDWDMKRKCWYKTCPACPLEVTSTEDYYENARDHLVKFFHESNTTNDGMQSYCISCQRDSGKHRSRGINREHRLLLQNGICGMPGCGKPISFKNRTATVDHDHKTHVTRMVLCYKHNTWMAAIDDDEFLDIAIAYRDKYR